MRGPAVLTAFGLPWLVAVAVAGADPTYPLVDYFPLVPGATTNYRFSGYAGEGAFSDFTFQARVASPESLNDRTVWPIEWWVGNAVGHASYYEVTGVGLNLCKELDGGDVHSFSPPLQLLPATLVPGQTLTSQSPMTNIWSDGTVLTGTRSWSATVVDIETVTVPLGTFSALRVDWAEVQELFWTDTVGSWKERNDHTGSLWLTLGVGQLKFNEVGTEQAFFWTGSRYALGQWDSQNLTIEAVPEPTTLSLLVLGGLAILPHRRK